MYSFFFFKQKTAYEMRISDWSSDVCSSDLRSRTMVLLKHPMITCIEDLRVLARKRVPRMFYEYADTGSWTESTYRANEADFQSLLLRQRVAVHISRCSHRRSEQRRVGHECVSTCSYRWQLVY